MPGDEAGVTGARAGRRGAQSVDRLDRHLEVLVGQRTPRIDDRVGPCGDRQVRGSDDRGGRARRGDRDVRQRPRGHISLGLLRVAQVREPIDRLAADEDVDRWGRRRVSDREPALAGSDGCRVVGEQGCRRLAVGRQVRDRRVVGAFVEGDRDRADCRVGVVRGVGGRDGHGVLAGGDRERAGHHPRLEVVDRQLVVEIDIDRQARHTVEHGQLGRACCLGGAGAEKECRQCDQAGDRTGHEGGEGPAHESSGGEWHRGGPQCLYSSLQSRAPGRMQSRAH